MADEVFIIGSDVKIEVSVKKDSAAYTPSPLSGNAGEVDITDPDGSEDVSDGAMTEEETGTLYYSYSTTGKSPGTYKVVVWLTDGSRKTAIKGFFRLERA